ncbi:MAG: hypothetical protein J6C82_05605, partial [Clostridia bacterium]|nr:hypothetical protein [Clostridia bacterium]
MLNSKSKTTRLPRGLSVSINLSARLQMPKKEAEFFVLKHVGVRGYGRALKQKKQSFTTFSIKNIIN